MVFMRCGHRCRDLPPDMGRYVDEKPLSCGVLCDADGDGEGDGSGYG